LFGTDLGGYETGIDRRADRGNFSNTELIKSRREGWQNNKMVRPGGIGTPQYANQGRQIFNVSTGIPHDDVRVSEGGFYGNEEVDKLRGRRATNNDGGRTYFGVLRPNVGGTQNKYPSVGAIASTGDGFGRGYAGRADRTDRLSNGRSATEIRNNRVDHQDGNLVYRFFGGDIQKKLTKAFAVSNFDYSPVDEDELLQTRDIIQRASGLLELSPKKIRQLSGSRIILNTPAGMWQPGVYGDTHPSGTSRIGDKNVRGNTTFEEALQHELYHIVQFKLHGADRGSFGKIPFHEKPIYPIFEGSAEVALKNMRADVYDEIKDKIIKYGLSSESILPGLPLDIVRGIKTSVNASPEALRDYAYPSVVLQDYKNNAGVVELDKWVGEAIKLGVPYSMLSQYRAIFGGDGIGDIEKFAEHIKKIGGIIGYQQGGIVSPRGYQSGGKIPGYGGGDKIPALLEAGEYVHFPACPFRLYSPC